MTGAPSILIVEARFYEDIADQLAAGAIAAVEKRGGTYRRIAVPGALEIPQVVRYAVVRSESGNGHSFDGYVALGCVIRGETTHYDHVCTESISGLHRLALRYSLAVGTGILTCENRDQAWRRAAVDQGNKGAAAANAALDLVELRQSLLAGQ
ncbi:MAG: 6,7-dimethyl-8-ribityllumazine synthase [Proteobacteria bacterium]|nr:6,7-dimethyl-8-ribityllumazine synthase [Pseudomonadota bacterium]MDA1059291.1 6,7-dimethyl-8-ribityllumazine synthase [Pseudomonadota bacterium]